MTDQGFLRQFLDELAAKMEPEGFIETLAEIADLFEQTAAGGRKVMLAGNGASASIASHFALDFTKQAGVRSVAFNDAAFLTAYGNDFGYENWVAKAIEHHAKPQDVALLISSSGTSENVVRGAAAAKAMDCAVVTLTGFAPDNPLRAAGDLSLWIDSRSYNLVESAHALWLGALCDLLSHRRDRDER